jgi:hypothetical protein
MPPLVELVIWTFVAGLLTLLAAGFTLAVSQALNESYVGAALLAAMLALALWIAVILGPLRQAAQIVERIVGVGGEGDRPVARITANRAGLLELRGQIDRAVAAEEGTATEGRYRETDEVVYDLWVMRATSRKQMGEPKEPERPDRSMFA